jgi:hypothetical protein
MRKFFAVALGSAVALVGFAGAANASATIDLLWTSTGTPTVDITALGSSSAITPLRVILTAGPNGSQGAGVSVDYGSVAGLSVLGYMSTEGGNLPILLGTTSDTGTRVQNINSGALPPFVGAGLAEGESHQLGTVTFHKGAVGNGTFEITVDANGPTDGVLDLAGNNISSTTTFNSAFLVNVPEPGAISLLIMGLGGVMLAGRGRRS